MIEGLTYAILSSRDLPRTRRFFTDQLGLETEEDKGDVFSQFTTRAGTMWAISQAEPEHATGEIALYLQVADVDAAYAAWRERGVEMVSEPIDMPFGRTFAFRDPDGRVLHAVTPA